MRFSATSASREGKPGSQPRRPDKHWYRALASLVFEPDELVIISHAAKRVRALGDPVLAEEAESAIRKLSFDLPLPEVDASNESNPSSATIMADRAAPPYRENVFDLLNDALVRRKSVRFLYHSMSTDQDSVRRVEPYGLFFLSANWYLAARDTDKEELRNFRLSRIRNLEVNSTKSQTADYEIPANFNLRRHARLKRPWDLGDGDANDLMTRARSTEHQHDGHGREPAATHPASHPRNWRWSRTRHLRNRGSDCQHQRVLWLSDAAARPVKMYFEPYGAATSARDLTTRQNAGVDGFACA